MKPAVSWRFLVAFAFVLACNACSRGAEVTHGSDERLGPGRWTVDGVAIGSGYDDVEDLLGEGEQVGFGSSPVHRFGRRRTAVTFDADGKATRVSGSALQHDGETVLSTGRGKEAVVATLGEGVIIARFSPKTSGVFTTGSVPNGVEYYYHDGVDRFEVFVNRQDVIGGIHSGRMDRFPVPGS